MRAMPAVARQSVSLPVRGRRVTVSPSTASAPVVVGASVVVTSTESSSTVVVVPSIVVVVISCTPVVLVDEVLDVEDLLVEDVLDVVVEFDGPRWQNSMWEIPVALALPNGITCTVPSAAPSA